LGLKKLPLVSYYLGQVELELGDDAASKRALKQELEVNPGHIRAKQLYDLVYVKANVPVVTITLFLLNLVIFFTTFPKITFDQVLMFGAHTFSLSWSSVITSLFFHLDGLHFILNMFFLLSVGIILEKHIGSFRFLVIYLVSGVLGNLAGAILISPSIVLGASSALFGIFAALLMREPLLNVRVFGLFKVPLIMFFGAFFAFMYLMQIFSLQTTYLLGDLAHMAGFLFGLFALACFYPSTVSVFYYWLFIAGGFWLFVEGLTQAISGFIVSSVTLILIALLAILLSYRQLSMLKGGKDNEN
jgi:rhomboid protease GluP